MGSTLADAQDHCEMVSTSDPHAEHGSQATAHAAEETLAGDQTLLPGGEAAPDRTAQLDRAIASTRVGRFLLLDRIGAGAMGVVYAGYDDVLDRKIAIKLVLPRVAVDARARDRLLREAQALAKLRHPNVVQVYDAGVDDDRLFIAMEFVQGTTLGQWSAAEAEPRPWTEVLEVYGQAGRGLAAAHSAGLVHRDFKPDNAMLGEDDVVRVMDFGLARPGPDPATNDDDDDDDNDVPVSAAGDASARAGTPAYMAPEQWDGVLVDARADQFSFCVAVFEALWGRRPFEAETLPALALAVIEGKRIEDPPDRGVPERVRRAIVRGLCPDPNDRWPSMDALLSELTVERPASLRAGWVLGGLGLLLGAGGLLTALGQSSAAQCEGVEQTVAEVWNPTRQAAVRQALESIDAGYSADTAARLDVLLARYAGQLTEGRMAACEATVVRHEQSEDLMLRRMRCLDRRQRALDSQLRVFEEPDTEILERAIELALDLPSIDRCSDLAYVSADIPPPSDPETAAEVDEIRELLARADALVDSAKFNAALPIAEHAHERAQASGYEPVMVESLSQLAAVHLERSDGTTALALARDAYVRLGEDSVLPAIEAHRVLGQVLRKLGRREDALVEYRRALVLHDRFTPRPLAISAEINNEMAVALDQQGRHEEAIERSERAIEIWTELSGPRSRGIASVYNNLGSFRLEQGRYDEGLAMLRNALDIRVELLGPTHPYVGMVHSNIASAFSDMGRKEQAVETYRKSIEIIEAAYGDRNVMAGRVRDNLGTVLRDQGHLEEALLEHDKAREIFAHATDVEPMFIMENFNVTGICLRRMGRLDDAITEYRKALEFAAGFLEPDNPRLAQLYHNLGNALRLRGDLEQSLGEHQTAVAIRRKSLDPNHPGHAHSYRYIGHVLYAMGRDQEAQDVLLKSMSIHRATLDPGHPQLVPLHLLLARVYLRTGQIDQAVEHAEHALEIRQRFPLDGSEVSEAHLTLGRALWVIGDDREHARSLVEQATKSLRGFGTRRAPLLAEAEDWLAQHPA